MDSKKVFNKIVEDLSNYLETNKIKSMVLGISGGIDSTLCSLICREVSDRTGIKFIGRSLPIKNKTDEWDLSEEVGYNFCEDFSTEKRLVSYYNFFKDNFSDKVKSTPISKGNIQARLRMTYLYNLASENHGLVIGTDNKTEWNLGFWTLHGDVGDIYPILDLWKTEVYELSEWCLDNICRSDKEKEVLQKSINITPTDGLGISNSDLDQIGASSYGQVDHILKLILSGNIKGGIVSDTYKKIKERHEKSEFKRVAKPIYIKLK